MAVEMVSENPPIPSSDRSKTTSTTPASIGLIIGSTRQPRAGPQITNFIHNIITTSPAFSPISSSYSLTTIDLANWNLPMFDEPTIPSQIHSSSDYIQPHTQAWSREISKHSAFIFVTPQYNWGYPAALKNAIDYLFNEWKSKPALIVTYGGHGGTKCAAQLRIVLEGLGMVVCQTSPALSFSGREMLKTAAMGGDLKLVRNEGENETERHEGVWDKYREEIEKGFLELVVALHIRTGS